MNFPAPGDYIDIHNHGATPATGVFTVETLMAHEDREPQNIRGITFSFGIHPWHLDEKNHDQLIARVIKLAGNPDVRPSVKPVSTGLRGLRPNFSRRLLKNRL